MKNSNLNNEYLDDEIDLIELLRTLYSSKKLIIIVTLAFSLLAFIYTTQKEAEYQSTVILEVGSYDLTNGEKKIVEPVSSLIKKLRINQVSQQLNKLNFNSIEDQFLEINYTSPSPEFNENLIYEAIRFTQESHAETLDKIVNSFSEKIVAIDNQLENQKIKVINLKKSIENKIYTLESKNKILLKLIAEEKNNLALWKFYEQAIDIKAAIQNLQQEKDTLELQDTEVYIKADSKYVQLQQEKDTLELQDTEVYIKADSKYVQLQQEKDTLELQVKLVNDQKSTIQPIRELETSEIKQKQLLTILIGTIFGFIFSIFIVFIRQAFLKEQN
jgi:LPS O-antigen subunit length determinant protein (WzzB/FepE family)